MKSATGLNTRSRSKPGANAGKGEYTQRTASGNGGGKCIKPTGGGTAKSRMMKGPFGGASPQS